MFEGIKVIVGMISLFMVYRTITRNCNKYLAFAICAIWLRFFLSAFHTITYPSLIAGFSINALSSISIAALGLFLIPTKVFTLRKLLPFYFLFAAIGISGFVNMKIPGTINVLVKWSYFLVLTGAVFLSVRAQGQSETFKRLLVAFFMPVTLQVLSILLGQLCFPYRLNAAKYNKISNFVVYAGCRFACPCQLPDSYSDNSPDCSNILLFVGRAAVETFPKSPCTNDCKHDYGYDFFGAFGFYARTICGCRDTGIKSRPDL
jgi:hypothetical protein